VSHPAQPPAFDPDEDLFDFAGVVRQADTEPEEDLDEIFASFRDAPRSEELLVVPTASASHAPAPATVASSSPPPVPAPPAAPVASPTVTTHAAPRPPEPAPRARATPDHASAEAQPAERARETVVPAARRTRSTKSLVAIALSVTLLNSVLAVVALRRPTSVPSSPPQADEHDSEALAAPAREPQRAVPLPDPDEVDVAHAHPTLDEARAEIARGEYASARQRVYGLLAIIDRLEEPRRGALEGDCQFLIAQSLHLEALARMGESR